VLGTANHWALDVVAGIAVVLFGLWMARLTSRTMA
jgi:hypothetical protein